MANRLVNFLEENEIISEKQFGFRRGHSTVHPMILLDNYVVEAFNRKQHVIAIFCDLRKAFDTVHHGKLLKKLRKIGVTGLAFEWFKSYLTNRKQFVQVDNSISGLLDIAMGVPQGSILGPIARTLYINDLPEVSLLYALLFADDTTLLAAHADLAELCRFVNTEFKKVTDYFRANLLSLHVKKTKYIVFTTSRNANLNGCHLYIDNNNSNEPFNPDLKTELVRISPESEPNIRFLGLLVDPTLSYKDHAQKIAQKISTSLYFMRTAKHFLTEKALKLVYYSLVHSHLIYAIQIWSSCPQSNVDQLFKLQKKAIRILSNAGYNAHTQPIFKKMKILPLPDLITFFRLQFMQRFSFGLAPRIFVDVWTTQAARHHQNLHNYLLRNSDNLYIPPARINSNDKHPFHLFPRIWSDFDAFDIKFTRNKSEFNLKLKKFLLEKIPATPDCRRLFCPSCNRAGINNSV